MGKSNMIKRADGSYSQRGLWDNIRANKGSGKKPTKQMLEQEAKIKAKSKYADGGIKLKFDNSQNEIDPKTGQPTGRGGLEDASWEALQAVTGAAALGKAGKLAYDAYKLSKPGIINLSKTYYPTYNKALKEVGKALLPFADGGKVPLTAGGEKHLIYRKESPTGNGKGKKGDIMVTHPTMDKGQWDTIDLTQKAGAQTIAEGIAATKKWHAENPEYAYGGELNKEIDMKYGKGGSIHIKPENKGKFTSWAKSHGMGVQEAASHVMANKDKYSSTVVKRANFAKNASKWKHALGGETGENTTGLKFNTQPMVAESSGVNTPTFAQPNIPSKEQLKFLPLGDSRRTVPSTSQYAAPTPMNDYQKQQMSNMNKPNLGNVIAENTKHALHTADLPQLKMMEQITGKQEFPSDALRRVANQYGGSLMDTGIGRTAVNALGLAGDVVLDPLNVNPFGGWEAKGLKTAHKLYHGAHHALDYPVRVNKAIHNATGGGDSSATHHAMGGYVPKYSYVNGKFIPTHGFGDTTVGAGIKEGGAIAPTLGLAGAFVGDNNSPLGQALDYGAQGASAGMMFGPWGAAIGGGLGLVGGAVKGYMDQEEQAKKQIEYDQQKKNANTYAQLMGKGPQSNLNIKTNNQALYAAGGMKVVSKNHPNPQEEVEGGETAITPNGRNIQFRGPKHNNGGIKTNLPAGTRIFSDRIIYPG